MALRILFVGVVISLALDLPDRGATPSKWRASQSWLDARVMAPASPRGFVVIAEPTSQEAVIPSLPTETIVADLPEVTVDEVVEVAPEVPSSETYPAIPASLILPGRIEAAFLAAVEPLVSDLDAAPEAAPELPTVPMVADATDLVDPVAEVAPPVEVTQVEEVTQVADDSVPSEGILADIAPVTIAEPVVVIDEAVALTPTDPDAAFREVVGQMAQTFAAELAVPAPQEPTTLIAAEEIPEAPAPAAEQVVLVDEVAAEPDDVVFSLADELNQASQGLEPIAFPIVAAAVAEAPEPADAPEAEDRENRLAHAVQLTGQAMQAWASLLVQRPAVISVQR